MCDDSRRGETPVAGRAMAFNKRLFTSALRHISRTHNVWLDRYDMVKLHVLTDFFHVLEEGEPAIGGQPKVLLYGPVAQEAYDLVLQWSEVGGDFHVVPLQRKYMAPNSETDDDWADIAWPAVEAATAKAWELHGPMVQFQDSQHFFHDPENFFGEVWWRKSNGGKGPWGAPIDWMEVVEAYERKTGEDHSDTKTLLAAPTGAQLRALAAALPAPKQYWDD